MAKRGAVISPSLLENPVPTKRSKECHERFRLGMGEWTESSEDDSSAQSEAPRKKMKLSVRKEKDKENRWQFVFCFVFYLLMKRKSRHLGRSSYPRTPLLALNGP